MSNEEKFMAIQLLGKLLEAQYTFVKTDLQGKPETPPYPKSILDSADKLKVQNKLMELVASLDPDYRKSTAEEKRVDYDQSITTTSGIKSSTFTSITSTNGTV